MQAVHSCIIGAASIGMPELRGKTWPMLVGFVLFFAVVSALSYLPNRIVRQDDALWRKADNISSILSTYTNSKYKIPANLAEAGFSASTPNGITYRKDSDSQYTLCITYQRSGNVRSANAYGTEAPNFANDIVVTTDYAVVPAKHKAGRNCIVVKPQLDGYKANAANNNNQALSESPEGKTLVCGTQVDKYSAVGPLLSLEPTEVYLNNSQTKQAVTMVKINYSQIPGDAGGMSYMYGPGSKIFDQGCKELAVTDLKKDDNVGVYSIFSDQTGSVTVFLKQ